MSSCVFCQIVEGKIPSAKLYETDSVLAFLDINPINPGHTLIIPKRHATSIFDVDEEDLKECAVVAAKVARAVRKATGCDGMNVLQNNFRVAGQIIDHFHIHLIPRFENDGFLTSWPGKPYGEGKMEEMRKAILEHI
ncbi:MAG TPA: HIT family protein [Thermodesulforhabdus norvegica]|uniref:HIT family protein n=1 Tax=Thermodesulforhabdus norvegica TaxID=39841 RepID=A0A7C1B2D1_9BACT|nr:HIT family protein [Deltaproteobacteria bacterium]MBW2068743.1 HIT family protein [Deltaproteobacteria bacterium]HDL90641.1 HIT family protein [Thermodesulforhabdus norvegica]